MKFRVVFSAAVTLLAAGCSSLPDQPQNQPRAAEWSVKTSQPASLIRHLPEDTVLYARVPSLAALVGAPKPNAMGDLLDSDANETALRQILASTRRELSTLGPDGQLADLLLERLRSPLEIAVRLPEGQGLTASEVYASARLDFESFDAFQQRLTTLLDRGTSVRLNHPATPDSAGFMTLGMMPAYYRFDAAQQRFSMVAGFAANPDLLDGIDPATAKSRPNHPALRRQADMDDSGYGLYVWADAKTALPQVTAFIPPQRLAEIRANGLASLEEVAFAVGTDQGRGQISAYARGGEGQLWDLALPPVEATELTTVGEPDLLMSLNLPDSDWLDRAMVAAGVDSAELDTGLAPYDLSLAGIMNGLHGRVLVVTDDTGDYGVLEPVDPEAFRRLLDRLSTAGVMTTTAHDYQGRVIEHWHLPLAKFSEPADAAGLRILNRSNNSNLWALRSGDRWLLASVPQVLMARLHQDPGFEVSPWLADAGEPESERSLVVLGTVDQQVQSNYHLYLEFLQFVAEIVDAPVDLMTFPPVFAQALPDTSTASLSVSYQNRSLRLALGYENYPLDTTGGGMAALATLGILSAVAIPQYQEYVERAEAAQF